MNYPLISEYVEAIKSAEDNLDELSYLKPVLDDNGMPVMTSGNYAVVFKMQDKYAGVLHALKCFTREQDGREKAYHQIADMLNGVDSPYLMSIRYFDKELFVDTEQTTENEFPVLLMDWVDGIALDKYLFQNLNSKYALEMLTYRFNQLAQWIIPQPFAHGDLKPDNILVREDGSLVLVDYDGMYVPSMKGQKARELGSPDFRHPLRTENDFDEHIDDFPISSILLSLKVIAIKPCYFHWFGSPNRLLLTSEDYTNIDNSKCLSAIKLLLADKEITMLLGWFFLNLGGARLDNAYRICLKEPNRFTLFESEKERFIYDIQCCQKEPGNFFSEKLVETYGLENVEIDIVDSLYKERVCKKIKELFLMVDLKKNVYLINILWLLLNHDYNTWDDSNKKIRESWLTLPMSYYCMISGYVDSIESGKGEWVIWYNAQNYPMDETEIRKYSYKSDDMFSLDTVVSLSYEIFRRLRLITRFLNHGKNAIGIINSHVSLTETNYCGFQVGTFEDEFLPI